MSLRMMSSSEDFDERVKKIKNEIDGLKGQSSELDEKVINHLFSQLESLTTELHTMVNTEIDSLPKTKPKTEPKTKAKHIKVVQK